MATNKGYLFIFCLYKNYDESVRDCLPKHLNKFGKNDLKNYGEDKSELYSIDSQSLDITNQSSKECVLLYQMDVSILIYLHNIIAFR